MYVAYCSVLVSGQEATVAEFNSSTNMVVLHTETDSRRKCFV